MNRKPTPATDPTTDPRQDPASDRRRLHAQLHAQTARLPLPERERELVETVIDLLDDDGYLRLELADVAALVGLDPERDYFELNTALRLVQSLQPAGVGARTLAESVLLQRRRAAHGARHLQASPGSTRGLR
jgi:RNA polymerase sigma-54 factor